MIAKKTFDQTSDLKEVNPFHPDASVKTKLEAARAYLKQIENDAASVALLMMQANELDSVVGKTFKSVGVNRYAAVSLGAATGANQLNELAPRVLSGGFLETLVEIKS